MKNVTYLGLCWAMTLGLVAVAFGQQAPTAPNNDPYLHRQPQANGPGRQIGAFDTQRKSAPDQQSGIPAPSAPQDRSMIAGGSQPGQPTANGSQPRGELGVWMVESGGPGVAIQRVTRGSAAEQAGLREGDIILQVNGRGAASPQAAAQMIRQIAIGQSGMLTIWRDGDQQQLQVTMQPAREIARDIARESSHQVGFGGSEAAANGELASRTMKLEQQISTLTQELQQLRQELAQLRTAGPVQQTGFNSEATQGATPQNAPQPSFTPPAATSPAAPPSGFGESVEKPAKPVAEPAKPATPPAAEKPAASDPFGSAPPQPKAEEKPKTEEKPKADSKSGDDLFK